MLQLLSRAKTWYIDGTFKVGRAPFTQLYSIHAFLQKEGDTKQVPLLFALMSSRKKKDYKAVLKSVLQLLPGEPSVKRLVMDFEMAIWKAAESVLPEAERKGCAFHWANAVVSHIKSLGLLPTYYNDRPTNRYCRRLIALPFLPEEHIPTMFQELARDASTSQLQMLVHYIQRTWIDSDVWNPASWSVFLQAIRTNNDVEGWHRRLNSYAHGNQLNLYLLIDLLWEESQFIKLQVTLLSAKKLKREKRKRQRELEGKVFRAWDDFVAGDVSPMDLLRRVGRVYAPMPPKPSINSDN